MFPLADARGRVLGFGARAMAEGRGPKYLNTSENEIYHKGRQLFGIDLARAHAARSGRIVVVEGYTDVLALHQAGIRESVAIMGTALTAEQMAELGRAATLVVLALDADRSGQEAMLRAARVAQDRGVELRAVEMPEGTDPADLLAAGGAEAICEAAGRRSRNDRVSGPPGTCRCRSRYARRQGQSLEEARGLIAATPERTAMRDELVREVADRLDVPAEYVRTTSRVPRAAAPRVRAPGRRLGGRGRVPRGARVPDSLPGQRRARSALPGAADRRAVLVRDDAARARAPPRRTSTTRSPALSEDDPTLGALVSDVVHAAQEQPPKPESVLRLSILQLERAGSSARSAAPPRRATTLCRRELAAAEQAVRERDWARSWGRRHER